MTAYPADSLVTVRPFAQRPDGDMVVIGDLDRQVFLSIPAEGLDILQSLADGATVGETVRRYRDKYHETPDIDDFLDVLTEEGFVAPGSAAAPVAGTDSAPASNVSWSSHLEWLSYETCRRLVSMPVLVAAAVVVLGALVLVALDPGVLPAATVLVFRENFAVSMTLTVIVMLAGIMVHEFAHVIAARAAGIPARIGIGHRLYIMVVETDMSGIWLASRRERHIAFLSGPIIDAVFASGIIGVLYAARHGALDLSPFAAQLTAAFLWTYLSRLLWQCFFFLRTDFYYVFSTATGCRDLKADTENFLRNLRARVLRIGSRVDQSGIPRREMRAVRAYSGFFLLGNVITIAALLFVTLPILYGYGVEIGRFLTGRPSGFSSIDFIVLFVLAAIIDGGGLFLWLRSLYRGFRARRAAAARPAAVTKVEPPVTSAAR